MRDSMGRLATSALLAACLGIAAAPFAPGARAAERQWHYVEGQLLIFVSPTYPEQSLKLGESSTVEVTGKIQPDGTFVNTEFWSEPPSVFLEAAVRKVAPYWRLQPRLESPSCQFRETPGKVTVWFEIVDGKPKVSYSRIRPEAQKLPAFGIAPTLTDRVPTRTTEPVPPPASVRSLGTPREVLQVAYVGVLADGTVHSVSVAPRRFFKDYDTSLRNALRQWRFEPADRPGCTEIEVKFQLE